MKLYCNLHCMFGEAKRIRLYRVRKVLLKTYFSTVDKEEINPCLKNTVFWIVLSVSKWHEEHQSAI